ncbi:MAG: ATP-binding protein [Bacteroidetes bacterium]|nr:ATP-binding protein [Bacteroidota bacterium]
MAYDADASHVNIFFEFYPNSIKNILEIVIEDDGHGMS